LRKTDTRNGNCRVGSVDLKLMIGRARLRSCLLRLTMTTDRVFRLDRTVQDLEAGEGLYLAAGEGLSAAISREPAAFPAVSRNL
jgi:hypothetical protein